MTFIIEAILGIIAGYCGGQWLRIAYWYFTGQMTDGETIYLNDLAFKFGLCAILALGFAGLMLK